MSLGRLRHLASRTPNTLGIFIVGLFLVLLGSGPARSAMAAAPTNLIQSQAYYVDPTGELTFAQVQNKTFTPYTGILAKGYTSGAFWLKIRIDPALVVGSSSPGGGFSIGQFRQRPEELVVRVRPTYLDDIRLYDPLEPNRPERLAGDSHPWLLDEFRSFNHGFVIPKESESRDIWLRLQSTSTMLVGVDVYPYDVTAGLERRQEMINSIDVVLVLFFIFWGGLLFFMRPDRVVGAFLVAMVVSFFFATNYMGYYRIFFADDLPAGFSNHAYSVLVMMMPAAYMLFHRQLLSEYKPPRWMFQLLLLPQYYVVIGLVLFFGGFPTLALALNALLAVAGLIWICIILLVGVKQPVATEDQPPLISKYWLLAYYLVLSWVYALLTLPAFGLIEPTSTSLGRSIVQSVVSLGALAGIVFLRGRLLEQSRQRALAAAEQSASFEKNKRQEQDEFFAMLTHEIRTPLTVMAYAAQTPMPDGQLSGHVKHGIEEIDQIIERCVQADRADQGRETLRLETVAVIDLIEAALKGFYPKRIKRDIEPVALELITTDPSLFQIVLTNLIDNALKYSPPLSPIDLLARAQSLGEREGISFTVINTEGPAGAPDTTKMFDKYYRAPRARKITGSGLGLFVAKSFAVKIGGELRYQATYNQIRFELWMPVSKS
jgi:two-component system, sensor histidine kinase LadS